jgi:hypothetical protein
VQHPAQVAIAALLLLVAGPAAARAQAALPIGTVASTTVTDGAPAGREPDPDGRPGLAIPLEIGGTYEEGLDSAVGDHWDWFVVRAPSAGSLVVVTRLADGESGDLVLEAFTSGEFAEPAVRSDQDLQGDTGHESVTVRVQAGQTVHLRVSSAYGTTSRVRYRISSSILP